MYTDIHTSISTYDAMFIAGIGSLGKYLQTEYHIQSVGIEITTASPYIQANQRLIS
jgi:hypothetical protein